MSSRLHPLIRKEQILEHAMHCARRHGYAQVTRRAVADAAGVSEALVSVYWGTMIQLRRSIMRHAIKHGDAQIVAQGLAMRDPHAMKAPDDLKAQAAATLGA